VETITETAHAHPILQPSHGQMYTTRNSLRHNLRNPTAHSFGRDDAVLASYRACQAALNVKLDPLFTHVYPQFRKQTVGDIEQDAKCSFSDFINSTSYAPPEVLKKTPDTEASLIISEASTALGDEGKHALVHAKQALAQQLKTILLINPLKRQGVPCILLSLT